MLSLIEIYRNENLLNINIKSSENDTYTILRRYLSIQLIIKYILKFEMLYDNINCE